MITLKNIVKAYDGKKESGRAVDGLNLEIRKGEFVALLGPSGCGKTTTLMMLAGLLKPTSGEIYFGERMVNHVEPKDRNIGMVFQSYALYPHLTVRDNIAFPLRERKMRKPEAYERAREISKIVQIDHLLDRKPAQLSGGQQQRVAMARALAKSPEILLLDEPMSNLDARLKLDVRDEIRKIQRDLGVTTIIVTHDQEEALAISDRVAILNDGRIQQYAPPNELFGQPVNLFVASFLGNPPMNLVPGTIVMSGGEQTIATSGFQYRIPRERQLDAAHIGKPVKLGLRPHDMTLTGADDPEAIPMRVDLVEHLGSGKLVKVTDPNKKLESMIRLLTDNETDVQSGDTVHLRVRADKFHLFDMTDNGLNLMQYR
ncbi:ABC transporter ATP-binding protein [Paenibacillus sacheonensis]|uniref:ATP-binding cassette domain-containing protein n=1 Tax=Paenibacillus sacheonensis TaxID=742054 RepID=A0A7X4YJH3_9BACL|nr:ABC transporter ATP-binding protein [Paenibacillus sacheonensis]MBM7564270.1 inositol-phosphate transport system ATP-binding protein [Paenibacillus sacheonensis]NBC67407.1 ATP-binding cassette domain-containing protein [Paenibacillus sacheonensis]